MHTSPPLPPSRSLASFRPVIRPLRVSRPAARLCVLSSPGCRAAKKTVSLSSTKSNREYWNAITIRFPCSSAAHSLTFLLRASLRRCYLWVDKNGNATLRARGAGTKGRERADMQKIKSKWENLYEITDKVEKINAQLAIRYMLLRAHKNI